jgi:glc operon protein GlcG
MLEQAQKAIAHALEKAKSDYNKPICVAIVDAYGFLVAFARQDGAPVRSVEISQRKAYTAVRMGVTTEAFLERIRKQNIEAGWFGDGLCALPGGAVFKDGGGIGISGLAAEQDQAIADSAVARS